MAEQIDKYTEKLFADPIEVMTPLVKNLNNPAYMEILLDGKENLVEPFADLGPSWITNAAPGSQSGIGRLLPGFRALINNPTLLEQVAQSSSRYLG